MANGRCCVLQKGKNGAMLVNLDKTIFLLAFHQNFFFRLSKIMQLHPKIALFFWILEYLWWWTDSNNWIFPIFLQFSGGRSYVGKTSWTTYPQNYKFLTSEPKGQGNNSHVLYSPDETDSARNFNIDEFCCFYCVAPM